MKKILFSLLWLGICTANATTFVPAFQGTSSGKFTNPAGRSGMVTTGAGTNHFTWGTPTHVNGHDTASSFKYDGKHFAVNENDRFVFGTLTYFNGTISRGTGAKSVDLDVSLDFVSPSGIDENFIFDLGLINTTNTKNANRSADIVNVGSSRSYNFFSASGVDYTLEFLGFSNLAGAGFVVGNSFRVLENETARIDLVGRITSSPSAVPVPAAVWLFGSGILGLFSLRSKVLTNV